MPHDEAVGPRARRGVRRPVRRGARCCAARRAGGRVRSIACRWRAAASPGRPAPARQRGHRAAARAGGALGAPTIVGNIVIIEDVTERVQLEEQLQISEKMASIGPAGRRRRARSQHAADRHFELHADAARAGADPDDPRTRVLEKIERQTFRAAKIVNGLLNLVAPGAAGRRAAPVDINAVITDVLSLLEHQFERRQDQGAPRARGAAARWCRASSTSCSRCS